MATEKLQLYNTMTKKLETFKPLVEGKVGMYVCGVTAYDLSHIGHARAYVAFDVLYRYLKHLNYDVKYVRNFTDVDDKIIRRANERGEDPLALSGRYCQEFLQDMDDLNCLRPTDQPRVSEHIDEIKKMIAKIMENNCAYEAEGGDVYFEVDKFPDYGKLSGRKLEHNRAGERVAVDSRKRNPADFALWKAAKPGELKWESPWGEGRPGWHIECSAMSACYLTHSFDIHGGGMDLTFPHHENELAQSCAACQESKVSYWVHNGFVNANDEKMSKSIGNFFTIREVTKLYHPLALRYFLMKSHYRSAVNYSIEEIEKASLAVFSVYQTLQGCEEALAPFAEGTQQEVVQQNGKKAQISKDTSAGIKKIQECISKLQSEFQKKMSNDLHAGDILTGVLDEALTLMNSSLSQLKKKKKRDEQLVLSRSLKELENEVKQVLSIVGLLPPSTYSEVLQQLKDKALTRAGLTEADVQRVIEERVVVRKAGEYAKSDEMRGELLSKGIQLQDVGKETVWIPCIPIVQEDKKSSDEEDKKSAVQVDEKSTPSAPDAKAQAASILAPEAKAQAADLKEQEQVSPEAS